MDTSTTTQAFLLAYSRLTGVRYSVVSAVTFWVLENLANMDREIQFIWKSRWSSSKVLYIMARYSNYPLVIVSTYLSLLPENTQYQCSLRLNITWLGIYISAISSIILQLRVFALYNQNNVVKAAVIALFVGSFTAILVVAFVTLRTEAEITAPIPGTPFCTWNAQNIFYAVWIPLMSFDCLLFVLVCYRSFWHYRSSVDGASLWTGQRLVTIIARDSVLYFLCGVAMYLFNTLVWILAPPDYFGIGTLWVVVIMPAAVTRLVLNLREEYEAAQMPRFVCETLLIEVMHNTAQNFSSDFITGENTTVAGSEVH